MLDLPTFGFFRQVDYQARLAMCLVQCRNTSELQSISKEPHCIFFSKEDDEAVLDPPLHIPPGECVRLRGAGQGVGPLVYGGLQ